MQTLCEPCKLLRSGVRERCDNDVYTRTFVHHRDYASWQQAIELCCIICVRLQPSFQYENTPDLTFKGEEAHPVSGLTSYELVSYGYNEHSAAIVFRRGKYSVARLGIEQWSEQTEQTGTVKSNNTGEDSALDFLHAQHQQCLAEHAECQRPPNDFMPTRVIDVGPVDHHSVRVCEKTEIPFGAEYIALSHCWGKLLPLTLTKSNITKLKQSFADDELSKTFRDAITVTRRFQHQYIWIDSLCIIQDDAEDWRIESAQMRNVYQNAAFCIAATAAIDGSVGLFFDRDARSLESFKLGTSWPQDTIWPLPGTFRCSFAWPDAFAHIDSAPLNQRGWVCQERFLSPRVLHFARRYLFYECPDGITSEMHPDGLPGEIQSGNVDNDLYSLKRAMSDSEHLILSSSSLSQEESTEAIYLETTSDIYWHWCKFRALYTSFKLTHESDIFVALHGIAQDVGERLDDQLVAGLWKRRLIEELCWAVGRRRKGPDRPTKWRAPSWSWAASLQTIKASRSGFGPATRRDMGEVVSIKIESNARGDMVRGVLTLSCRLIPFPLAPLGGLASPGSTSHKRPKNTTWNLEARFDESGTRRSNDDYLVILRRHERLPPYVECEDEGIIVTRSADEPDCYIRVGYFSSQEEELREAFEVQEECTISLV